MEKDKTRGYGSYRIGNKAIGITKIPDRKSFALYVQDGNVVYPIAYMREDRADKLWAYMRKFIGREDWQEINADRQEL